MLYRVIAAMLAFGLLPGVASAQSTTGKDTSTNAKPGMSSDSKQTLPQEITQKLTSQGFTNVEVVPGSYLVSAKDKSGDPVTMIIGPHSMTMFTLVKQDSSAKPHGSGK